LDRFSVNGIVLFSKGAISVSVLDAAEHCAYGTEVLCSVIAAVMLGR